jgi:hypothetical protein
MSATTDTLRDQAFLPLACDIPPGLSLAEYRERRPLRPPKPPRRRLRRWTRRASR